MSDIRDLAKELMEKVINVQNEHKGHIDRLNKIAENGAKLAGIVSDQHSGNMLLNEKMNGIIERIENLEKEQN